MKFIRKNGRIIPLRSKDDGSNDLKAAERAVVSGIGAKLIGVSVSNGLFHALNKDSVTVGGFTKKYSDFIKEAGSPDIRTWPGPSLSFMGPIPEKGSSFRHIFEKFEVFRPTVLLGSPASEAAALHEVGHIRSSIRSFSMNKLYTKLTAATFRGGFKGKAASLGIIAKPFTNVVAEAEATGEAIRAATKLGGAKEGLKIAGKLAPAYAGYVANAAGLGLMGYGAYRLGKAILKRPEK